MFCLFIRRVLVRFMPFLLSSLLTNKDDNDDDIINGHRLQMTPPRTPIT